MQESLFITRTKEWIRRFVIGLNLCPFAQDPFQKDQIRYVCEEEEDLIRITNLVLEEVKILLDTDPNEIETTFVILPQLKLKFTDFHEFSELLSVILVESKLDQEIRIIAFHPQFQYADSEPEDVTNATNRSPFPMLHILRQKSIDEVSNEKMGIDIARRNREVLSDMSKEELDQIRN